jgi:hypothetical protein
LPNYKYYWKICKHKNHPKDKTDYVNMSVYERGGGEEMGHGWAWRRTGWGYQCPAAWKGMSPRKKKPFAANAVKGFIFVSWSSVFCYSAGIR